MKSTISNYTFNASAKTITLTDYSSIRLESLLIITNVTRGVIIYQFNDVTKGGSVSSNILTLTFDTTSYSNTDKLMIIFEDFKTQSLPVLSSNPSVVLTRTSDTNTYAVDDVWGGRFSLSLPITGNDNTCLILNKINLKTSLTTLPSGFGSFRMFLFTNTTDSGNILDNAAFTRRQEAIDYDGYLLNALVKSTNDLGGRSTTYDINSFINIPNSVNTLHGYLVTNTSYIPLANADTITIKALFLLA